MIENEHKVLEYVLAPAYPSRISSCSDKFIHARICYYMFVHICSYMFTFVHLCSFMFIYVHICSYMFIYFIFVHLCSYMFKKVHICSMFIYVVPTNESSLINCAPKFQNFWASDWLLGFLQTHLLRN